MIKFGSLLAVTCLGVIWPILALFISLDISLTRTSAYNNTSLILFIMLVEMVIIYLWYRVSHLSTPINTESEPQNGQLEAN